MVENTSLIMDRTLLSVEAQTVGFMKRIQAHCRSLGLRHKSSKQSAAVDHSWYGPTGPRLLAIDGWHGTGEKWGQGKLWHTWYAWDMVDAKSRQDFLPDFTSKIDYVRGRDRQYVAYFMKPEHRDEYLANLVTQEAAIIAYLNERVK